MHSKSYLHFTIFLRFLSISVDGFHVNNSDTDSMSGSIRSTDHPENTFDSLSDSFIELITQLTGIQVYLETKTRDMEKRDIELSLKEKEAEKQKDGIKRQEELLKQKEEHINKTDSQVKLREADVKQKEEIINKKETEVKNNEEFLKTREKQLNEKENELEKSHADVRKKIEQLKQNEENIKKTETEIKKREEILKKNEEKFKNNEKSVCTVSWVSASNGNVPANALEGGKDRDRDDTLYIGRTNHNSSPIPGKIHPRYMSLFIADHGHEYKYANYEVATFADEKNFCSVCWVKASNGSVPTNAIVGGHDSHGENLYIGRAIHEGYWTPGKVQPSLHGVLIPYGYLEHRYTEYEVAIAIG